MRFQFVQCCILADWMLCMIIVQKRVFDCIISWILLYSKRVNSRIDINPASNQGNVAAYDQFQDQRSIDRYVQCITMKITLHTSCISNALYEIYSIWYRYTNPSYRDPYGYGQRRSDQYITCRKIFTDWENTRLLKENYNVDPRNRRYFKWLGIHLLHI